MRPVLIALCTLPLLLTAGCKDSDGDGVRDGLDCAPENPEVFPDAEETCNGRDDNCNGQIDEDVAKLTYLDRDRDGYGDETMALRTCVLPENGAFTPGDCDDTDPLLNPAADELCDGIDNDCNGVIDDGDSEGTFYADTDGDGYGDPNASVTTDCTQPDGYVSNTDDCDDSQALAWTGAEESCDGIDNDCDGTIDEDLPLVQVWQDADADGAGDPATPGVACGPSPGWADNPLDCDDSDASIGVQGGEVQGNGVDEDCDGYIDEYAVPSGWSSVEDALAGGADAAGSVIQFDAGIHVVNVDLSGVTDVTLAGEGCDRTTLYGAANNPVVTVTSGAVEGLTLSGGTAQRGGGLLVEGGVVRVSGVCAENNVADGRGGGVAVSSGQLEIEDSRISGNRALIGAGLYVNHGAVLVARRLQLVDNQADLYGGGMGARGGFAHLQNVTLVENTAGIAGGGAYWGNDTQLTSSTDRIWRGGGSCVHCTFHGNSLLDDALTGAAVYASGTTVHLEYVGFTDHSEPARVIQSNDSALGTSGWISELMLSTAGLALHGNYGNDMLGTWWIDAERGSPLFAVAPDGTDSGRIDLRLRAGSAWTGRAVVSDADADGVPDGCDVCPGADDGMDADGDGVPDGCDRCPTGDDTLDDDRDGVPDDCDVYPGDDDGLDTDEDGIPNGLQALYGTDCLSLVDDDSDGVFDECDVCPGGDDSLDSDGDGVPDDCDVCPDEDDNLAPDSDGDGVPDACDRCPLGPDGVDHNGNLTPDACDLCPVGAGVDEAGAPADLGAFGGAGATTVIGPPPLMRPWPSPVGATVDTDADGVPDTWEQATGSDWLVADATSDPDADGLDNLDEYAAETRADTPDTDADGVLDGSDPAPTNPADHRPVAVVSADTIAPVLGEVVLDGSASLDPNGDPLTYTWAVVDAPPTSIPGLSPLGASVTLIADQPGDYTLSLTVDDGTASDTATVQVKARAGVFVPDSAADLDGALAQISDGEAVFLRAGVYAPPTSPILDLDVAIVGVDGSDSVSISGGQGIVSEGSDLHLASLTLDSGTGVDGGCLTALRGDGLGSLWLRDVVVRDCVGTLGGGIHAAVPLDGADLVVRDNLALAGGGLYSTHVSTVVRSEWLGNEAGRGGALAVDAGTLTLHNAVFNSNGANLGAVADVAETATLDLAQAAVADSRGGAVIRNGGLAATRGVVWLESGATWVLDGVAGPDPVFFPLDTHLDGNSSFWSNPSDPAAILPVGAGDSGVLHYTDNGDPDDDLFGVRPGSALAEKSWSGWTDPDGSLADIGPAGGPLAWGTLRQAGHDVDADGLADGWEVHFGLDPADPADASSDTDGDGASALDEYLAGSDPTAVDTDGDGVTDDVEIAAGDDPASSADHRPVARAESTGGAYEDEVHLIDGSTSSDPDGDPLTYTWRFIQIPADSSLTDLDLVQDVQTSFQPDTGGVFLLGLVVSDGTLSSHELVLQKNVAAVHQVPTEFATASDAMASAQPGDRIDLEAGTHEVQLTTWVEDVWVRGAGVDATTVVGLDARPVFLVNSNQSAFITDLTVTGSSGNNGVLECTLAEVELERVRFEHNSGYNASVLYGDGCTITLTDVDMMDNECAVGGTVTLSWNPNLSNPSTLTWTRGQVGRNISNFGLIDATRTDLFVTNVVFHHNASKGSGAVLYQAGFPVWDPGHAEFAHVTAVANTAINGVFHVLDFHLRDSIVEQNEVPTLTISAPLSAVVSIEDIAVHGNLDGGVAEDTSGLVPTPWQLGPGRYADFDVANGSGPQDLRQWGASPYVGGFTSLTNGDSIDALTDSINPDGSTGDLGAFGGPDAPDGWDAFQIDTDGDGAPDAWELLYGLDPNLSDASLDLDFDGLSSLFEYEVLQSDPTLVDTDGDGQTDTDEFLAGSDPTDATDQGPTADAGPNIGGRQPGMMVNVTGSYTDPQGDPATTWAWTLEQAPGRSALTTADIQNDGMGGMSITVDTPGTFVIGLQVEAGGGWSAVDTMDIQVEGTVLVPEDYATVQEAIVGVVRDNTISVGPGVWPVNGIPEKSKNFSILGQGMGVTILDGGAMGSVLELLYTDTVVTLADLSIVNGSAAYGGGIRSQNNTVILDRVELAGNIATYGGGLYALNSTVTLQECRVLDNVASRFGGGIRAKNSPTLVDRTLFAGNGVTGRHGGALQAEDSIVDVANAVFADNWSDRRGGAVYASGSLDNGTPKSQISLNYVTFAGNLALTQGSSIEIEEADVVVSNAVFVGDIGPGSVSMYGADSGRTRSYAQRFSLLESNPDGDYFEFDSAVVLPFTGDADGNIVGGSADLSAWNNDGDWTNDDWTLGPASDAIDAGDPAELDVDGSSADMGAFGGPAGDWVP